MWCHYEPINKNAFTEPCTVDKQGQHHRNTFFAPEKGEDTFTEGDLEHLLGDSCSDLLTEMAALIEGADKTSSTINDQLA